MHTSLVTSLTRNQPYYIRGGLIPHLTKKGFFWKSMAPANHRAVLKYRLHIDAVNSAYLEKMDKIDCGWTPLLPRLHHHDGATGFHILLGPDCALKDVQYWPLLRQRHQLHPQCLGVAQCKDSLSTLNRCR